MREVLHGGYHLDPVLQIAPHAIGGTDEVLLVTAVPEVIDTGVLEEASDDADHPDVFRKPRHPGADPAGVPDDEVDLDAREAGPVEGAGDVGVLQRVHLELDVPLPPPALQLDLPVDLGEQGLLQLLRRGQELAVTPVRRVAGGEEIEQLGRVVADVLVAGHQPEIGVDPRGVGVVVARSDVHVAAQPAVVAAHDQDDLAVGLQPHHTVGHVNAGFLHPAGPADVGGLVEPRLQLHRDGHLLAVLRRVDQIVDHLRAARRAVEGHLDGAHLGVAARLREEPLHRGAEGLVGVLQEQGAVLADDVKNAAGALQLRVVDGAMRGVVQRGDLDARNLEQVARRHHAVGLEDVRLAVQAQLGAEHPATDRVHSGLDLDPDDGGELAVAKLALDEGHQVVRVLLVALGVGVAGHEERLDRHHLHPREEQVQVVGHDVLEGGEAQTPLQAQEPGDAGPHRHLHAREGEIAVRVAQRHQQVQGQVRDEREGVRRVDGLRGDEREDVLEVVLAQSLLFAVREVVVFEEEHPVRLELAQQRRDERVTLRLELADDRVARLDLLLRSAPVGAQVLEARSHLLFEPADPLHEEFVEVRADDGRELHALQEWRALVHPLVQHAAVELEPGQLPVQEDAGRLQVDLRRGCGCWRGCDRGVGSEGRGKGLGCRGGGFLGHGRRAVISDWRERGGTAPRIRRRCGPS